MNGTEQNVFFSSGNSRGAILYIRLISAVVYLQSVLYVYPFFITLRVMIINLEHFLSRCQYEHNRDWRYVVFNGTCARFLH